MARLRGKRWMADIRSPQGERLRPTFATQESAEKWEEEAREAIRLGKPIPEVTAALEGRSAPEAMKTLGGLADFVWNTQWAHQRSRKTHMIQMTAVLDFFGRNKLVEEIDLVAIEAMKNFFFEKGNAPATVNRKCSTLSKMLGVAVDAGVINRKPKFSWRQEPKTRFRYLDENEEATLLAYWKLHDGAQMHNLCMFLIDTGARCYSEALPVKWEDFGPDFRTVTFWSTKTNQPRTVPLTSRLREFLKVRREEAPLSKGPFLTTKGVLSKSTMRHRWQLMRDVTGMSDVTPHTLRHTCCTRLVLGGVDIKRVMEWMGHTRIETTMRYMQIKPRGLEDVLHIMERKVA